MKREEIKKTYSKNNNKIILFADGGTAIPTCKTVLIIGVVHGDEPQGKFLIENYLELMEKKPKNRMLFIPCLNPDGMELNTRQNSNGVDINRNFSTKNWELTEKNEFFGGESPSSEIETEFVEKIIEEFKPDLILTLHAPFKIVNFDGPADKIAQKISELINYPVQSYIGYPTPGSFGTYAGVERNIPTLTLELDEEMDVKILVEPINKIFDYLSDI